MLVACSGDKGLAAFLKAKGYYWRCWHLNWEGLEVLAIRKSSYKKHDARPQFDQENALALRAFYDLVSSEPEGLPFKAAIGETSIRCWPESAELTQDTAMVVHFPRYRELAAHILEYNGSR